MNAKAVKEILLRQMEQYLDGEITKEEYADIAEPFYSKYAHLIAYTQFYDVFTDSIPDCCIINVDEPGNEDEKERDFHRSLKKTYEQLKIM